MTDRESRDRLVELLEKADDEQAEKNPKTMEEFYGNIADHLIANGVTIPVRCKDCKYLMFSDMYGECKKGYLGVVLPDNYCSYGVRKESDRNG